MTTGNYRAEIDGLRALAVLSVVFFHFALPGFGGGFVGVDVFFVISGFLITSLIINELNNGTFSFLKFWERRARRILPAYCAITLITFIIGWNLLLPNDLKELGQSILSQSFFSSNIFFWKNSGYFDGPSELKPLLHTWSLSVEEQFYIFFPLILFTINKYYKSLIPYFITIGIIFSFILSVWGVQNFPSATFYLLPTRAWELLFGSLLSIIPKNIFRKTFRETLGWIGILMIIFSIFKFSKNTSFPGLNALFPCLGTALIIWSNGVERTFLGKILSNILFKKIGLISYSLYLIHWPLLVFVKYWLGRELNSFEIIFGIFLSIFLSYFSWMFIEIPLRNQKFLTNQKAIIFFSVISLNILGVIGLITHYKAGFYFRIPSKVASYLNGIDDKNPRQDECIISMTPEKVKEGKLCKIGKGSPVILSYGDSHSDAIMPVLEKLAKEYKFSVWHASYSGCPPIFGVFRVDKPKTHLCREFNDAILETIKKFKIKNVILASRWSVYPLGWEPGGINHGVDPLIGDSNLSSKSISDSKFVFENNFNLSINKLINLGINVWILEQVPEYKFLVPQTLALSSWFDKESPYSTHMLSDHLKRQNFVSSVFSKIDAKSVFYLNPTPYLCNQSGTCKIENNGHPLYKDEHHLSQNGAFYLKPLFSKMFEKIKNDNLRKIKGTNLAKNNFILPINKIPN